MRQRGFEIVSAYVKTGVSCPERKTGASAGYDLAAAEAAEIPPHGFAMVPTGLKTYMQADEVKRQLMLMNGVAVIDADYYGNADNEGHIIVPLYNYGKEPVHIAAGERIAQGIFTRYLTADGDAAGCGAARGGGFGSTGT